MTTSPKQARYPALHHRNFTLIWSGLLVSNMGTWMQNVAQSWLIYKLTGNNPLYLGWLGLSFAIPMVVVPPIGGALADRVNRIKLLYVTQTGSLVLAVVLAILTWTGVVQPFHILVTTFLGALLLAFDNPTRQALIPELVPREHLLNALSLNSATFTGAALVGPAIAGVLLDVVGAGWLFMGNAISFLAVIGALLVMTPMPQHRKSTSLHDAIFGGIVYVWQQKLILALLVLSALAAIFGRSYQQLLPVFAADIWHTGSSGYGILLAAGGGGALVGAFIMASLRQISSQGRVMSVSGLVFCLALAAFALSPLFWIGVALLVVVGVSSTIFTTMIATVIQLRVPNELRGRVMSLYAITLIGLPSLGALGVAALANALTDTARVGWTQITLKLLDIIGVNSVTRRLGSSAGAPRAIVLGVIVLTFTLILTTPGFLHVKASTVVLSEESIRPEQPELRQRQE